MQTTKTFIRLLTVDEDEDENEDEDKDDETNRPPNPSSRLGRRHQQAKQQPKKQTVLLKRTFLHPTQKGN